LKLKSAAGGEHRHRAHVCCVDMQGRLMGKRFHAQNFIDSAMRKPIAATTAGDRPGNGDAGRLCDDQLAGGLRRLCDEAGLSTMRRVPWLEGTAMVLCDLLDHHTHEPVAQSPRPCSRSRSRGSRRSD
jgi:glutamine synthetase